MNYLSTIINLIIPTQCLRCRASGYYLCPTCCARIPASAPISPQLSAVYSYHDPLIKQAIKRLKYRHGQIIAQDLGTALYGFWQELTGNQPDQDWLVLPAPSSCARSRGYNQTALLVRAFVTHNPVRLELRENVLIKNRETPSQVSLRTRAERLENLRNSVFISDPGLVAKRNVLVIDDLITTGATMQECRRALLIAGAGEVRGLAVAHG